MAKTAVIQNTFKAGMLVVIPTAKVMTSVMQATAIEGMHSYKALPILFSTDLFFTLSTAYAIMNILSTPIAKTRKGITSRLIMLDLTPKYEVPP